MNGRLWGMLAAIALLAGCAKNDAVGPGDLDVIPAQAFEEEPLPSRYRLIARAVVADSSAGALDLWLPLPPNDAHQAVLSLVWEVAQPATIEGTAETDAGGQELHVRSSRGLPEVLMRASIEMPLDRGGDLPATLSDLTPELDPAAWVAAARERGHVARLTQGLEVGPGGAAQGCQIPELETDGGWVPVDVRSRRMGLPDGRVRVARSPARAQAGGEPVEVSTTYTLERR